MDARNYQLRKTKSLEWPSHNDTHKAVWAEAQNVISAAESQRDGSTSEVSRQEVGLAVIRKHQQDEMNKKCSADNTQGCRQELVEGVSTFLSSPSLPSAFSPLHFLSSLIPSFLSP